MGLAAPWRAIRCSGAVSRTPRLGSRPPMNFNTTPPPLCVGRTSLGNTAFVTRKLSTGSQAEASQEKPWRETDLVRIERGSFFREYPSPNSDRSRANPVLFPNLDFTLSTVSKGLYDENRQELPLGPAWCIIGPSLSGKTSFLQMLRGDLICQPPGARWISPILDQKSIRYAGFDTAHRGGGLGKLSSSYLAERYESRQEGTDFTLKDYLLDNTELNPLSVNSLDADSQKLFDKVVAGLKLGSLLDLPVSFLSNGQGRRAIIAHALLHRPRLLLLDEPFMGLDPPTVVQLSRMLHEFVKDAAPLAEPGHQSPTLVLSARPQDPLPFWITHVLLLTTDYRVALLGQKTAVMAKIDSYVRTVLSGKAIENPVLPVSLLRGIGSVIDLSAIRTPERTDLARSGYDGERAASTEQPAAQPPVHIGEPIVEMNGCEVKYGEKPVLGNWGQQIDGEKRRGLYWTVRRGERWGVFGPNGSGKTTLVSLLCSDHPQTYSLPVKLFGRSRLPDPQSHEPPLTFWDIQERIGHSSPEVHQHMPRGLTVRQVLETAWADTFRSKPKLDNWAVGQIDATLAWFSPELNPAHGKQQQPPSSTAQSLHWAESCLFGELSFSAQRVLLLLRAIIKHPDIVVLDEAFSGMDEKVRDKCTSWLEEGNNTTCSSAKTTGEQQEKSMATTKGVVVDGLQDRQALICISHIKDEVPNSVNRWMCLPDANTESAARFGQLERPLRQGNSADWDKIWGLGQPQLSENKKI